MGGACGGVLDVVAGELRKISKISERDRRHGTHRIRSHAQPVKEMGSDSMQETCVALLSESEEIEGSCGRLETDEEEDRLRKPPHRRPHCFFG